MSTPIRLAAFAAGLGLAFGAAWGVGTTIDPVLDAPAESNHEQPNVEQPNLEQPSPQQPSHEGGGDDVQ